MKQYPLSQDIPSEYYNIIPADSKLDISQLLQYNSRFIECIEKIKKRHDPTTTSIAQGILELKKHWKVTNSPLHNGDGKEALPLPTAIQSFLDGFYMSRIDLLI